MTLSGYRLGIRLFALFGLLSLGVIILWVDPETLSAWGMTLFFICVGVSVSGCITLTLLFLSERFVGVEGARHYVGGALRQGVFCGLYGVVLLLLLFTKTFAWWIAGLIFVFFLLVEYTYRRLFLSYTRRT